MEARNDGFGAPGCPRYEVGFVHGPATTFDEPEQRVQLRLRSVANANRTARCLSLEATNRNDEEPYEVEALKNPGDDEDH